MIGKNTHAVSFWTQFLSSIRERYTFRDYIFCCSSKRTTMESAVQYMRDLSVGAMIVSYDTHNALLPTDPDELHCTRPVVSLGSLWQQWTGKPKRHEECMKWLASSSITEKLCLPQLYRNDLRTSSNLKKSCPAPLSYRQLSQLLGLSIPLF